MNTRNKLLQSIDLYQDRLDRLKDMPANKELALLVEISKKEIIDIISDMNWIELVSEIHKVNNEVMNALLYNEHIIDK